MRLIATALLALALGCGSEAHEGAFAGRYDRTQLRKALVEPESEAGILLGEFLLQNKGIVDGDTIKVEGLDASMRLLGLDCEETFKSDKALRAYEVGFEEYLRGEQAKTSHPVKVPTPMGMAAKQFAEAFFAGVARVKLERDHPKDIRDRYNRYLAYVLAEKDGKWVNYNVECVRAGMSPYFTKYGYATRYHAEMVAAQDEARAAERGIWDPALEHYRDYPVRLAWWDARAEFVTAFARDAKGKNDHIVLTHWDSLQQLDRKEGDEIVLLGNVGDVRKGRDGAPTRVMLGRRMFDDFPLVFFDDEVFDATRLEHAQGEFVRVRGTVAKYRFRGKRRGQRGEEQLQIVVKDPRQIEFVDTWALAKQAVSAAPVPAPADPTDTPVPTPAPTPADAKDAMDPTARPTSAPAEPAGPTVTITPPAG
ncbi:MAG: thermonuclease family protein [Deltaproteobacteria bacterium]|nr:thermonuclease family protein [Nannocystaceae bacterium]